MARHSLAVARMGRSAVALELKAVPSNDVRRPARRKGPRHIAVGVAVSTCILGVSLGLKHLPAATPAVDRSAVLVDQVKRGTMLREVQGQGTLIPEDIRWVTAVVAARVDRVHALPGSRVEADTVLVDLLNPDLELQALEADRQLGQAQSELATLQATLTNQRLAQESAVATLDADDKDAERRAAADATLAKSGFVSPLEMATSETKATSLAIRRTFEQKRLAAMVQGGSAQLQAHRQQLERLKAIAVFRHQALDGLHVRAGVAGVLEELPLQPGQSVVLGALLAKVVQPERLKAELRIAASSAGEVEIGQKSSVDGHHGVVSGRVTRIDPAATSGTVTVDVQFDGPLPPGARPQLSIEGTIEVERLSNVLYVGRPVTAQPESTASLFKLVGDDGDAVRTRLTLGKASAKTIEVRDGLAEGDWVILSDTTQWDSAERVRLR